MTEEEAIEIVLAGKPWEMCLGCHGLSFKYKMDGDNMMVDDPVLCTECRGTGCLLKVDYRRACRVLRRRPPKAKVGHWPLIEDRKLAGEFDYAARRTQYGPDPDDELPESSPFR